MSEASGANTGNSAIKWSLLALMIASVGTAGSIWLSLGRQLTIGMDLIPCPLCYYQRTFIMCVAGLFLIGLATPLRHSGLLHVLALPAALGGLFVAGFHVYLELNGTLECPGGVYDIGSAPQQSLGIFVLLLIAVGLGVKRAARNGELGAAAVVLTLLAGFVFAAGAIMSAAPIGKQTTRHKEPFKKCRPPYRG